MNYVLLALCACLYLFIGGVVSGYLGNGGWTTVLWPFFLLALVLAGLIDMLDKAIGAPREIGRLLAAKVHERRERKYRKEPK